MSLPSDIETLPRLYRDAADLLSTPPEDLTLMLLAIARIATKVQNGMFDPGYVNEIALGNHDYRPNAPRFANVESPKILHHLEEAWLGIARDGLMMNAPAPNGANGYRVFTKRGEAAASAVDFKKLRDAALFPKALIHPLIAEDTWNAIMRSDLGGAVFTAFKAVEEAVRNAAGLTPHHHGVSLMQEAFKRGTGPLTDPNATPGEQNAMINLFSGAMGAFRNPNAHRTVAFTDVREAQEQVMFASLLLRIVDQRKP